MKRFAPLSRLVTVFSLFLVFAIWLTPASANTPPVFTSIGQLRAPGMGTPAAMDLDDAGNLYVADAQGRKIYCFDQYGNLSRVYSDAAFKYADNQGLTSGRGLAVSPDGKRLYFARNQQALILDTATGTVIGELTGSGDVPEFKLTAEIDIDARGNVLVADAGSGRQTIKVYSPEGRFINKFGGVGNLDGNFQSIACLTINDAGQIVVADSSPASLSGKIQAFTVDANYNVTNVVGYLKNTAVNFGSVEMHTPRGAVFDHLGRGYFLEYIFSTITVVNSSFQYLSKYNAPVNGQYLLTGYQQGQIAYVIDLMFDKVNKRLFVSCDGGRIEVFGIDGGTSPVYVNTPPTVPAVKSPTNGIIVLTATPTLEYAAASDDRDTATLTYQVVIKRGDAIVHTFAPTTATSVTVPAGLLADDLYSWTVQAIDSKGLASDFSPAATFVVDTNDPPSIPVLQSPVAGGVLATDSPSVPQILSFAAATDDADTSLDYQVKILQGGTEVYATTTKATSIELTGENKLADNANYSWMVQAVDSKGAVSGFSPAAAFTVNINDPPSLPVPQTPVGSSVVESDAPALTYAAATDDNDTQLTYQVEVKQAGVVVYAASSTTTSLVVPAGTLQENASYSWAVQAVDSKGLASGFSPAESFVVNAVSEAPTAPLLQTELAAGALANERQFAWSASTDPDPNDMVKGYRVELAADAGFATAYDVLDVESTSVALGDFAKYADLEVGASYFCRVSAIDLAGNATASEPVSFVYATAVLTVDADIKGAAVYLGGNLAYPGRPVGVTPLEVRDLAPGFYVVAVQAPGFELSLNQRRLAALGRTSVYAQLKPAQQPTAFKGAKAINGKPGLKVGAGAVPFVIDFDGDGKLDLLAGDANGSVSLFRSIQVSGSGDMTVGQAEAVPALVGKILPGAVPFVADWNNDDQNDLLIGLADGTVKLFLAGAAESLLQAGDVPLAVGANAAPAVVDLNRDGLKDLVVGNALGQVFACYNAGTDAAPKLAAPVQLLSVGVPVVPTVVDWNSDGFRELMVASAKGIAVYSNETGTFVPAPLLATPAKAVFAVNADGSKGEDLVIGAEDGRLLFAPASSFIYPSAYPQALGAKVDEIETLAVAAQETTAEVMAVIATIRGQIAIGSYGGVAVQGQNLAAALANAEAKAAAEELVALSNVEATNGTGTGSTDPKPVKSGK
mgnify:CR=1 FL=1